MNPGDLVRNRWDGYLPMYKEIHGIHSTHYFSTEIGMILDFQYSRTDIPYVKILTTEGKTGWVRYEQVRVIR